MFRIGSMLMHWLELIIWVTGREDGRAYHCDTERGKRAKSMFCPYMMSDRSSPTLLSKVRWWYRSLLDRNTAILQLSCYMVKCLHQQEFHLDNSNAWCPQPSVQAVLWPRAQQLLRSPSWTKIRKERKGFCRKTE